MGVGSPLTTFRIWQVAGLSASYTTISGDAIEDGRESCRAGARPPRCWRLL